jgi:hypothetical protein
VTQTVTHTHTKRRIPWSKFPTTMEYALTPSKQATRSAPAAARTQTPPAQVPPVPAANPATVEAAKVAAEKAAADAAAKKAAAQEEKAARFKKLAIKRVNKALRTLDAVIALGNRRSYAYTDEQANKIMESLQLKLDTTKKAFQSGTDAPAGFSL